MEMSAPRTDVNEIELHLFSGLFGRYESSRSFPD